jgi:hypothetical protein
MPIRDHNLRVSSATEDTFFADSPLSGPEVASRLQLAPIIAIIRSKPVFAIAPISDLTRASRDVSEMPKRDILLIREVAKDIVAQHS